MNKLEDFINDKMNALLVIEEYKNNVDATCFCPFKQEEIAALIPCGKVKANLLING